MRSFDRVLSLVLALAGLALGVLVVAEVVLAGLDRPALTSYPQLTRWLERHAWSAGAVTSISAALLVAGLLLLAAELKPRRRTQLVLLPHDAGTVTTISTRSVGRLLESAASVPGVDGARATVRRTRARLRLRTHLRDQEAAASVLAQAEAAAGQALADLQLRRPPKLTVRGRTAA